MFNNKTAALSFSGNQQIVFTSD